MPVYLNGFQLNGLTMHFVWRLKLFIVESSFSVLMMTLNSVRFAKVVFHVFGKNFFFVFKRNIHTDNCFLI